jgi:hypothetical protein
MYIAVRPAKSQCKRGVSAGVYLKQIDVVKHLPPVRMRAWGQMLTGQSDNILKLSFLMSYILFLKNYIFSIILSFLQ